MFKLYLSLLFFLLLISFSLGQNKIELAGQWQFAIDSTDVGLEEKWFLNKFDDTINLPGSMSENGKGNDVSLNTRWTGNIIDSSFFIQPQYEKYRSPDNFKIPFWLQPNKYYYGAAWYKKEIIIPADWADKSLDLFLERCHWQSTLWVDNKLVGSQNGLSAPHIFDLTGKLSPGKHTLTLRVDNRIKDINPGVNSHSVSDHTQTNWNGIVGKMFISAKDKIHFSGIRVFPDPASKQAKVEMQIRNLTGKVQKLNLSVIAESEEGNNQKELLKRIIKDVSLKDGDTIITVDYSLGNDARLWDEFNPNLYKISCGVSGSNYKDSIDATFGLRKIEAKGTSFFINNNLTFLRGTLECAIFPKTGYPSTDVNEWLRIFKKCKEYGLNHVRFHSWCPPEAAFKAADKTGIYLHVECSSWANQGSSLGDGKPIDNYIYEESERIVKEFGNHPSFCFLLYGNEPDGIKHESFLTGFVNYWKNKDNRRLYCAGAGWPLIEANDFHDTYEPRIQLWGAGLNSIINKEPPSTNYDWRNFVLRYNKPIVSHEIGQWCVYPNFNEISKYNGILKAKNFEIFRESLIDNGMEQLADSFLHASGKLQVLCYKAEIEAALRTKGMGGFQLLDLHDFPGQGTALVGVLDPFWEEKGYVKADEYRQFCNTTVLLARMTKFIFNSEENFSAVAEVAHFGPGTLSDITPSWKVMNDAGNIIKEGKLKRTDIPSGNGFELGKINFSLNEMKSPAMYIFRLEAGEFSNQWDFWVYPYENKTAVFNNDIKIKRTLDSVAVDFLNKGGSVLLTPVKGSVKPSKGGDIAVGFSSIFWNTAWTLRQAPHTLGILCNPEHPMLKDFPTQYHSNYQWWDAMSYSNALLLSELGFVQPVVRIIDDWFMNRPLGLIIEAKAGNGKIIITGIDLLTDAEKRPAARQLTYSIINYMQSSSFNPSQEIDINKIKELFNE